MLEIITGKENPILRKISTPIKSFDKKLKSLVKKMEETLKNANGLGLAAPQVGINERLFLAKLKDRFIVMINPEITHESEITAIDEEGCLSLPGTWGKVERSREITVKYQDIQEKTNILKLHDLEAREILHEYDHLNGILFTDKLKTPITENLSTKKTEKADSPS